MRDLLWHAESCMCGWDQKRDSAGSVQPVLSTLLDRIGAPEASDIPDCWTNVTVTSGRGAHVRRDEQGRDTRLAHLTLRPCSESDVPCLLRSGHVHAAEQLNRITIEVMTREQPVHQPRHDDPAEGRTGRVCGPDTDRASQVLDDAVHHGDSIWKKLRIQMQTTRTDTRDSPGRDRLRWTLQHPSDCIPLFRTIARRGLSRFQLSLLPGVADSHG